MHPSCPYSSVKTFSDFEAGDGESNPLEAYLGRRLAFTEYFLCARHRSTCLHSSCHLGLEITSEVGLTDHFHS